MHKIALIAALALSAAATLPVFAADAAASGPTTQQNKMKSCNADAKGKTGADRKAFMKTCLSGSTAVAATPMTQQDKMKKCNADAKGQTGADRKAFMKTCLSA